MADKFHLFAKAVRKRFEEISQERLFVVDADRTAIWETYLGSFPPGSRSATACRAASAHSWRPDLGGGSFR